MPPVRPSTMRLLASSSMAILRLGALALTTPTPDFVDQQQDGTAGDGHVSDVECRKVPILPVEEQKIHHMAVQQAVDRVAERAAQDARQCGAEQGRVGVLAEQ